MTVVRTRFTLENAEWMAGMSRMDAQLDRFESRATRAGDALDFTKRIAGIAGMSLALDGLYNSMGRAIDRFNVLEGLDKGRLFFNANTQTEALKRGLSDLAIQASVTEQAIRFISADANLNPQQYTQMGQAARGFMLAGETKSIEEGIHALELYITGSQSRMLHRLGVGVATPYAYRQYAEQIGVNQRDLTGAQMMQARVNELFSNPGFTNTASFGQQAQSTGMQQFDAMFKNTKDSYIRSIAGAVEELATSVMHLNRETMGSDPNALMRRTDAIGRNLAEASPVALGLMSAGYSFAGRSGQNIQLQQLVAQFQGGVGPADTARMMAERQAEVSSLRLIETQQRYAGMFTRGPGGVSTPDPRILGPAGGVLRFDQWAPGASATLGRDRDALAASQAQRAYRDQVMATGRAQDQLASSSRAMWNVMGAQVGLAVLVSGWTAYTRALQDAEHATKNMQAIGKQGVSGGITLGQAQTGGASAAGLRALAEQNGLSGSYLDQFESFANQNPASPDLPSKFNELLLQQGQANVPDPSFWTQTLWGIGVPKPLDWSGSEEAALQVQGFKDAMAKEIAGRAALAKIGVTDDESIENYQALLGKIGNVQRFGDLRAQAAAAAGYTPEIPYYEQTQRQIDQMAMGYDLSRVSGAERSSIEAMQGAAIEREIFYQQQEKVREQEKETDQIKKRIAQNDREAQVRLEMAQQQDQMLGANKGLLDETNEHREKMRRDQQIVDQVIDLRAQGREDLINELGLNQQYQSSLQALTDAQIDFTKELQQAVLEIRRNATGMLDSAAATVGSVLGAQTDIATGLAGDNRYLAGGTALLGQFRGVGLSTAKYGLNQQLLDAAKSGQVTGNPLIDQALSSLPQNPVERGAYLNSLQDQQYKDADSIRRELGSVISGYLGLQTSLQNVPFEQRAMGEAFLSSQTAAEISRLLPFGFADAQRMGVLTPELMAGINKVLPGTFSSGMNGPGLAGQFGDQISSIGMQRSEVAQSNYDLKESIDALKSSIDALNLTSQGIPTAPPWQGPLAPGTGNASTWGFPVAGSPAGPLPPAFANQPGMITGSVSALTASGGLTIPGQGASMFSGPMPPAIGPMGWEQLAVFAKAQGFNVTSTTGGRHNKGSKHYQGLAVDVGVNGKSNAEIEAFMEAAAEAGIKVVDERTRPRGQAVWGGAHLHLEGGRATGNIAVNGGPNMSPVDAQRAYDSSLAAMRKHLDDAPPGNDASDAVLSGREERWAQLVKNAEVAFLNLEKSKAGSMAAVGGGWADTSQQGFREHGAPFSGPMPVYVVNMPGAAGAAAGGFAGAAGRVRQREFGRGAGVAEGLSAFYSGMAPSASNFFGGMAGEADFTFGGLADYEDYGSSQYGEFGGYSDGGVWNSDPRGATAVRNKPDS